MSEENAIHALVKALDSALAGLPQRLGRPADWVYYDMPLGSKLGLNEFLQLKLDLERADLGQCVAYSARSDRELKKQLARGQFIVSPVGLAMIEAALAGGATQ